MADKIISLSESDRQKLRWVYDQVEKLTRNTRNRPAVVEGDPLAPEVYVAVAPSGGIAAAALPVGTATDAIYLVPGTAECVVHRVVSAHGAWEIRPAGFDRKVFNLSTVAILGGTMFLIHRDKFGTWIAGDQVYVSPFQLTQVNITDACTGIVRCFNVPISMLATDCCPATGTGPVSLCPCPSPIPEYCAAFSSTSIAGGPMQFVACNDCFTTLYRHHTLSNFGTAFCTWGDLGSFTCDGAVPDGTYTIGMYFKNAGDVLFNGFTTYTLPTDSLVVELLVTFPSTSQEWRVFWVADSTGWNCLTPITLNYVLGAIGLLCDTPASVVVTPGACAGTGTGTGPSGVSIIALHGANLGTLSTTQTFSETVDAGLLVVAVHRWYSDGSTPSSGDTSVTWNGSPMTMDAEDSVISTDLGTTAAVWVFSLAVAAGTHDIVISKDGGIDTLCMIQTVNVLGLASNAHDRDSSQAGNNSAPDTGATAATTASDEALLAFCTFVDHTTGPPWTWTNSFSDLTIDAHNQIVNGHDCGATAGGRVVTATGTYSTGIGGGEAPDAWAARIVTYK